MRRNRSFPTLAPVRAIACDIDGTLMRFSEPIPGANHFLSFMRHIPFVLLSNTGTKMPSEVKQSLLAAGLDLEWLSEEQIVTAAHDLLVHLRGKNAWAIGPPELSDRFAASGFWTSIDAAAYVRMLQGEASDLEIALFVDGITPYTDIDTLSRVCTLVIHGATVWISAGDETLSRKVSPTLSSVVPGPGALVSLLKTSIPPEQHARIRVFGKGQHALPVQHAMQSLRAQGFSGKASEVLIVGDRFDTDIRAGRQFGMQTCLVESGCHTHADCARYPHDLPSMVTKSVAHLVSPGVAGRPVSLRTSFRQQLVALLYKMGIIVFETYAQARESCISYLNDTTLAPSRLRPPLRRIQSDTALCPCSHLVCWAGIKGASAPGGGVDKARTTRFGTQWRRGLQCVQFPNRFRSIDNSRLPS